MELRDYIVVRRAYGLVRQSADAGRRLTFPEFAILVRLDKDGGSSLKTSDIASWQSALRPTMTHRTKHLGRLGLIKREKGSADRRNVVCSLTDAGRRYAEQGCARMLKELSSDEGLADLSQERLEALICAMGSVGLMGADLVLLGVSLHSQEGASVGELVSVLGLLQPTVSMAVNELVADGLVERGAGDGARRGHAQRIFITDKGRVAADQLQSRIASIELAESGKEERLS